jgi:hypothetical protein
MMLTVYNGDCVDLLGAITPHLVLCDPPYRAEVHDQATSQSAKGGTRKRDLGFKSLSYNLRRTIAQFAKACPGWTLIFSDVESTNVWRHTMTAHGLEYIRTIPWVRWSMPQLSGDRPTTGWEAVTCYAQSGQKSWEGPGNLIELTSEPVEPFALRHNALRGEVKHKTEKPLDQALDLVSYFSRPGQLVFDPTCGSGTFGQAARLLGREFLGCELDPDWALMAQSRLESTFSARDEERINRYLEKALNEKPTPNETIPATARRMARRQDALIVQENYNAQK